MSRKLQFCSLKLPVVLIIFHAVGLTLMMARSVPPPPSSAPSAVNKITLSVSPNPAKVKQKVTLIATVTTNGKPATGGTVVFSDGTLPLGSAQVVGSKPAKGYATGTATLTTIVAPGAHSIVAEYEGTANAPKVARSKR